jgi:hypothetical protein
MQKSVKTRKKAALWVSVSSDSVDEVTART